MIMQAPVVPTTSDLATLDPAVAITLLIVVGLAIVGFYTKDYVKSRIAPKPADPPAGSNSATGTGVGAGALPAALPAVIDRSATVTDEYIAFLKTQIADRDRELEGKDREIARLNDLLQRASQWHRGNNP